MELHQLRCFVAAAEQLHFGRAAQHLQMLPSALGRQIRLLEEDLGTRLFARTTRAVSLTEDGTTLLRDARAILARVEAVESNLRNRSRAGAARRLRVGAIDSAAAGLLPPLLRDFRAGHPEVAVQLLEDKTDPATAEDPDRRARSRLRPSAGPAGQAAGIPRSASGDRDRGVPAAPRARRAQFITLADIADEADAGAGPPLAAAQPRPHDQAVRAGRALTPRIVQVADEKQTIIHLVATKLGVAIVPRWTTRMAVSGVRFVPLRPKQSGPVGRLPLAAAWLRGSRDPARDAMLAVLEARLRSYAREA